MTELIRFLMVRSCASWQEPCTLSAKPTHMCDPANMTGRSIGYRGHRQSSMPVHPAGLASKM